MEYLKKSDDDIVNPLLKNNFEIEVDDVITNLNIVNISKYFKKVYILILFKNEEIDPKIYCRNIDFNFWKSLSSKLVLDVTTIKIVKNIKHSHNLVVVNSEELQQFNHFGLELEEKILVLPMFTVSYLNFKKYLRIFEANFKLDDLYNIIFLADNFQSKDEKNSRVNFDSILYLNEIIKNLDESNFWVRKWNCLHTISKSWISRMFKLKVTRNLKDQEIINTIADLRKDKDNEVNNYIDKIYTEKNFVDAASCLFHNGYKLYHISKPSEYKKSEVYMLFTKLNVSQRYYLFCNMLISKTHCHLAINNQDVLKLMMRTIKCFSELFRYLFGYSWLRFLTEEGIKKSRITKNDEFIFDINTASLLPVFPFSLEEIKKNPYFPIKVNDKYLPGNKNIGGISFYTNGNDDNIGQGIVDLAGFKKRLNIFITGNGTNNIFNNLDMKELKMAITGSAMTACLQKQHPLLVLFKGKNNFNQSSEFDLDYGRFFSEYYPSADVDIMIKSTHPLDFIKKVKVIYNQVVVNVCAFNPSNAEPHHIKIRVIRTVYIFLTESFIKNEIEKNSCNYSFDYIMDHLKDEDVVNYFKSISKNKIEKYYEELFEEYNEAELRNLKSQHPEIFDFNETDFQIHISNKSLKKEESSNDDPTSSEESTDQMLNNHEIGINISFKVKIKTNHIQRQLELFQCKGEDFFALVSKFHLPCVRAYYDGSNVYMTPSCITSHLTYMNPDYKYFAGSNDEISIILKYRMRGFGTLLNKKEVDTLVKYSSKVIFWNRLYNLDLDNSETIEDCLGSLDYDHKVFHPRLYNVDLYEDDAPYVNINDGYNNSPTLEKMVSKQQMESWITSVMGGYHFDFKLIDLQTIGKDGYPKLVQKWIIDVVYNCCKIEFEVEKKDESRPPSPEFFPSGMDEIVLDV